MGFEALRARLLRLMVMYATENPGAVTPYQIGSVAIATSPDALTMAMSDVDRDGMAHIDTALFRALLVDLIIYPSQDDNG